MTDTHHTFGIRRHRRIALAMLLSALALFGLAASAEAATKQVDGFFGGPSINEGFGGQFLQIRDIAVDQSTGQIYTVEAQGPHQRVQRLSPGGEFELMWGKDVIRGNVSTGPEVCQVALDCKAGGAGTAAGEFNGPHGIGIDQSDPALGGDPSIYVLDLANHRVQKFDTEGDFILMLGDGVNQDTGGDVCTQASGDTCVAGTAGSGAGQLGTTSARPTLEVIPSSGELIVADPGNRRVVQLDPDAVNPFVRAWGWGVDSGPAGGVGADTGFEICTTASGCASGSTVAGNENGRFGSGPHYVAVDSGGMVYASDNNLRRIMRFDSTRIATTNSCEAGADPGLLCSPWLTQADGGPLSPGATRGIEVDLNTGNVFVSRSPFGGPNPIQEITSAGAEVVDSPHGLDGQLAVTSGSSPIENGDVKGLTLHQASGRLYIGAGEQDLGSGYFALDDDGAEPPLVTMGAPSAVTASGATLNATVNPGGVATYQFQYSKTGIEGSWVSAGPSTQVLGSGAIAVSRPITGLEANALYRVRLATTKVIGGQVRLPLEAISSEATLITDLAAPSVTTGLPLQVSDTGATLRGRINPNNMPTTYYFEYGGTDSYGTKVPLPAGEAGSDAQEQTFTHTFKGLPPGATYHYRLVATNAVGTSKGEDRTFTTRQPLPAPPGRAYEMVTPADKSSRITGHNFDHEGTPIGSPAIASPDGEHVLSTISFAILDAENPAAFPHSSDQVRISRQPDGRWTNESLYNIASPVNSVGANANVKGAAADFSVVAVNMWASLFPTGGTATRLYGDTGGYKGSGWYDWLGQGASAGTFAGDGEADFALIDDEGERIIRWGRYRGLAGIGDPSIGQQDPEAQSIYLQEPPGSGPLQLVQACSGVGEEATMLPARAGMGTSALPIGPGSAAALADDTIGLRGCEEGTATSDRGAALGGMGISRATAMSDDGSRIFFNSPDPGLQVVESSLGGDGRSTGCVAVSGSGPTATEHVGAATECPSQVYVRRLDSSGEPVVRWISRSRSQAGPDGSYGGTQIPGQKATLLGPALFEGASRDGRVVFIRTNSPLTPDDPNGEGSTPPGGHTEGSASYQSWDIYRYELPADPDADPDEGTLTRISGGAEGLDDPNSEKIDAGESTPAVRFVSDDGDRVYFVTKAPLAGADNSRPAGGSTDPGGNPATVSAWNLYLFDADKSGTAAWKFIARLPGAVSGFDRCASEGTGSGQGRAIGSLGLSVNHLGFNCMRGTSDGYTLTFTTSAQLTVDDDDAAVDVFVYDADAQSLERASAPTSAESPYSCESKGTTCNADFGFETYGAPEAPGVGLTGARHWNIAEDGTVYFETRLALLDEDRNERYYDVYAWKDGKLSLISPGDSADHAFFSGNSHDGEDVFIWTSQRISPWEIDEDDFDVYDARIGGGQPPPPPPPVLCSVLGGGCNGSGSAPPPAAAPASSGLRGAGNVSEAGSPREGQRSRCRTQAKARAQAERKLKAARRALGEASSSTAERQARQRLREAREKAETARKRAVRCRGGQR